VRSALTLALPLVLAACAESGQPQLDRADVLLVVVDTLRADRLGFAGYRRETSPNLDGWARSATVFTHAYAPSPWTFPSAASLFTGLYPAAHAGGIEGAPRDLSRTPRPNQLSPGYTTLAETLAAAGYRTALIASNPYLKQGNEQGFEHVDVIKERAGDRIDAALAWLGERGGEEPVFLVAHFIDVHEPNLPPAPFHAAFPALQGLTPDDILAASRWHKRFAGREPPAPGSGFHAYRERRRDLYDASIRYLDFELARLVAAFEARAPERALLFVFTSDHGEEFWEHVELGRTRFDDPRGLYGVGHGHTLFEEVVRVPLLVHAPGVFAAGVVETPVSLVDLLPTVVELVGTPHPAPVQGRSLVPALLGNELEERALYFGEPCFGGDQRGLLLDRFKLIRTDDAGTMLFDLQADPGEERDLVAAGDLPASDGRLADQLDRFARISATIRAALATDPDQPQELSPTDLETLRELGYLGDGDE